MDSKNDKSEYSYENNSPGHHHAYLVKPLIQMISNYTNTKNYDKEKIRILDVGCGNGSLSNLIAQLGYEVVGVEESKSGIQFATKTFSSCRFVQSSIYDLHNNCDLDGKFDVVISTEVIEHLYYPKELIRNATACLKSDGLLILTTPYHGYLKNLLLAISGKMDDHFTALWDCGHIKFFSVATMTQLLLAENCTDIKFKFAGRYPFLWKSMLCSCKLNRNDK